MAQTERRQFNLWLGLIVWCTLLAAISYGSTLRMPYMADDYFHIPFLNAHSLPEIWQTAKGLYYFRPVSFTLWKIMGLALGHHDLFAQHALNLILHAMNGVLVGWLADRLWRDDHRPDWRRVFLSATLFLLFPFSYEAVPWIGSLVHPLVTTTVLISAGGYSQWRGTGKHRWLALSLGMAGLAPFVHENGVLILPLLGVIELTRCERSRPLVNRLLSLAWWVIPLCVWYLIWHAVPSDRGGEHLALNSITNMLRNSAYLVQGAGYPLTWLGGGLRDQAAINEYVAAVGLGGLALLAAAAIQWRTQADRRSWLPWLWLAGSYSLVIVFLDYWYSSAAPRMLMLSSVGIAWLWTDVIVRFSDRPAPRLRRSIQSIAAIGLTVLIVAQNYGFIRDQLRLFNLGGAATQQMIDATVAANESGRPAVFFNLPVWMAAPQTTYPIGQEGSVFLTFFERLEQAVSVHTDRPAQVTGYRVDAIRSDVPYYMGVLGSEPDWTQLARAGGEVFATLYATDTVRVQPVGILSETVIAANRVASFDRALVLREAAAHATPDGLQVTLLWQVTGALPADVTVFVHVLDVNGQLIAQADGDPLAGAFPLGQWPVDYAARDVRLMSVPHAATVRVGVYSRSSGERLTAVSSTGAPLADNAVAIGLQP